MIGLSIFFSFAGSISGLFSPNYLMCRSGALIIFVLIITLLRSEGNQGDRKEKTGWPWAETDHDTSAADPFQAYILPSQQLRCNSFLLKKIIFDGATFR